MKRVQPIIQALVLLILVGCPYPILGLDLEEVFNLMDEHNPQIRALDAAVMAEKGRAQDAGRRSNPSLSFERQAVTSANPEQDQNLVTWSQGLDLRGRRVAERGLANQRILVQEGRRQEEIFRLRIEVRRAFIRALFAEEEVRVRQSFTDRLSSILEVIEKRVEAGEAAEYERDRLLFESIRARSDLEGARTRSSNNRGELAAVAGIDRDVLVEVSGSIDIPHSVRSSEELLQSGQARDPRIQVLRNRSSASIADGELARWLAKPEMELDLAYQRTRIPTREDGYGVKVSIQLPIFDRLVGRRDGARLEVGRLGLEEEARKARMRTLATTLVESFERERERAVTEKADFLERPDKITRVVDAAYQEGLRSLIELLDAYRITNDSRLSWLSRVENLHLLRVKIMDSLGIEDLSVPATNSLSFARIRHAPRKFPLADAPDRVVVARSTCCRPHLCLARFRGRLDCLSDARRCLSGPHGTHCDRSHRGSWSRSGGSRDPGHVPHRNGAEWLCRSATNSVLIRNWHIRGLG